MFVDNGQDTLTVLGKGLEQRGFTVTTNFSALKVMENFKEKEFSLLLADIQMPAMSGYDLYRKLYQIDPKIKVCFLSGHGEYSEAFRIIFPQMDEKCFMTKPVSTGQLADRLSSIIDS